MKRTRTQVRSDYSSFARLGPFSGLGDGLRPRAARHWPEPSTIVGTFSRFAPALDACLSYRGEDVVATLDRVCAEMGFPRTIRVDQGSEFVSGDLDLWAHRHGVVLDFSRPGKPTDSAFTRPSTGGSGQCV